MRAIGLIPSVAMTHWYAVPIAYGRDTGRVNKGGCHLKKETSCRVICIHRPSAPAGSLQKRTPNPAGGARAAHLTFIYCISSSRSVMCLLPSERFQEEFHQMSLSLTMGRAETDKPLQEQMC